MANFTLMRGRMRLFLTISAFLILSVTTFVGEAIPLVPAGRGQAKLTDPILGENEVLLFPMSNSRGEWFYAIDRDRLENLPTLDPKYPNPSLSIRDAIEEGERSLEERYPEIQDLTLNQVQFRKGDYPTGELWHYDVWFYGQEDPDSDRDIFSVIVPMDGIALVPRRRTDR